MVHPTGDFAPITESGPLVAELRDRIERDGPITFRDFMDAALYHPRFGYYRTRAGAMSRGGDYVTSPEVHPVFGALVAKQVAELREVMGNPDSFDVIEVGGGRGLLARDILRWAHANDTGLARAIRYTLVETSPALRSEQERAIDELGIPSGAVTWRDTLPDRIDGVVLSNELLDAFPVHRVVRQGNGVLEVYVTYRDGRFVDHLAGTSTPDLLDYFRLSGVLPGEGCFAEVNLEAPRWITSVASALRRGFVLTFDYGYEARDLYAPWRRDGTLLCFYRQSASSDPYQRVGKQDITASVDFTALRRTGESAGLRTIALTDQSSFLVRLGIGEGVGAATRDDPGALEEYLARRNVVLDLIDPGKLGRIKVMLQGKGVPEVAFRGFADD